MFILICILSSCDTFDSHKQLSGRYYLNDNKFGKCICYRVDDSDDFVGLIIGSVGSIGLDDKYIIVESGRYDYYIIPLYKKMTYFPEKGILGPLKASDFNQQKQKLKIKANFTINTN